MDFNFSGQLYNPGPEFQDFTPYRIKLCFGKLSIFQTSFPKRMQKHVCYAVKEQPKLIGLET